MRPRLWMYPLQFLFSSTVFVCAAPCKLLGLVMVPAGILTGWRYGITWPWDCARYADGSYADRWWYRQDHWSWKLGPRFAEFWWRAVRNAFSNGMRYMFDNSYREDLWVHPRSHAGFLKGPRRRAFADGAPLRKWLFRYVYDQRRWWFATFVFTWFVTDEVRKGGKLIRPGRYFQIYIGAKFDRLNGFGNTFRIWLYRDEP